jgi:PEP-CTERM motif
MSIRITRLAALVAAMLFATGASSQATYNLSTTVSNFSFNGVSVGLTSLSAGSMVTVGGNSLTLTNGGYQYIDAASGTTVYLANDSENLSTGVGVVQEQIFVNGPAGGYPSPPPAGQTGPSFNFTTNILVNGGPSSFTETLGTNTFGNVGYTLAGNGIVGGGIPSISPTSITIPGFLIQNIGTQAVSGNINLTSTNAGVSATFLASIPPVPEPASVVMLGLGLISVGGVAFRRRMAK